jgi:hypothetical protein
LNAKKEATSAVARRKRKEVPHLDTAQLRELDERVDRRTPIAAEDLTFLLNSSTRQNRSVRLATKVD